MIDLNDVWQAPARLDLGAIREQLGVTAADWLPGLFPQARLSPDRKTLRCADLSGRPPRSRRPRSLVNLLSHVPDTIIQRHPAFSKRQALGAPDLVRLSLLTPKGKRQ